SPYWNYIIDQDGYVRVHVWCKFKNGKVLQDNAHIYDCYGYFYPQKTGSVAQHEKLTNLITGPIDPDDANPPDANVAYEYYDAPH
ncbi:MAG: hypothetical protein K5697_13275, partial [Lachnospiraceae bacterium]|nr:hypothetical protein [Lachnospiraceae bacterium]